jgi:hypothetical protein
MPCETCLIRDECPQDGEHCLFLDEVLYTCRQCGERFPFLSADGTCLECVFESCGL